MRWIRNGLLGLGLLAIFALVGCGNDPDTSCAVCGMSETNASCQARAEAAGCATGETYESTFCDTPTLGCAFYGCTGALPMCVHTPSDAGPQSDGGT